MILDGSRERRLPESASLFGLGLTDPLGALGIGFGSLILCIRFVVEFEAVAPPAMCQGGGPECTPRVGVGSCEKRGGKH